jgi:hypothetical protein
VHRLARVHVEHVADAVAEAERIRRGVGVAARREAVVLLARAVERAPVVVAAAGLGDLVRHGRAEVGREALPLDGQHAVALEVAERAVVGDDLEAVAQRLEAAARPVAAVDALADEVAQHASALVAVERGDRGERLLLRRPGGLEQQRGQQPVLVAVDVQQPHGRPVLGIVAAVEAEPRDPALRRLAPALEEAHPLAAAVRPLDARDEARHHRLDRVEDALAVAARLRQRVRHQVQDQLLVCLARGVDAHVRE